MAINQSNLTAEIKQRQYTQNGELNDNIPGVGGVDPRELAPLEVESTSLTTPPRLLEEDVLDA